MPPVRPLEPSPMVARSRTTTDLPGASLRSQAAAERPEKPAPTITKSARAGSGREAGRKSICQGEVPQPWAYWRFFGLTGIGELDASPRALHAGAAKI